MNRVQKDELDAVLLLDKPTGISSNGALQRVKRLFRAKKAGHTGSLDPLASGLLPICFGEATKLSGFLLDTDKRYHVQVRLGIVTQTADSEGDIVEALPIPPLSGTKIEEVLSRFRGEIAQVPPMYSALKHRGKRLYDLAREGIHIEREPRTVHIYELCLQHFDAHHLVLEVHCSKGTYIRTLAEDIGYSLGCGGHVKALRRTTVGGLSVLEACSLRHLESLPDIKKYLLPVDRIINEWPVFQVSKEIAFMVFRGQEVSLLSSPSKGLVRLYCEENNAFLGIGEILEGGRLQPKRLLKHTQAS